MRIGPRSSFLELELKSGLREAKILVEILDSYSKVLGQFLGVSKIGLSSSSLELVLKLELSLEEVAERSCKT